MTRPALRLAVPALALLLSLGCAHARAAEDLPSTCAELIQEKATVRAGEPSIVKLLLKMLFDRGSFVNPLPVSAPGANSPAAALAAGPTGSASTDAKIRIFTLGHLEPVTAGDRALLKKVQEQEKQQLKDVNQLLKAKTADECARRAAKIGWSPDQLDALETLESSALEATRHEESQLSMKVAKKVAESSEKGRIAWDIVPVDSWGEIVQSLRSDPVSGMILIAHADQNGRLYDSQRDELPTGFFKGLPVSTRFIGIFSCESAEVIQAYQLDSLANDPAGHRDIVAVKLGAPFDVAATTPVQFFPMWVKKLEKSDSELAAPLSEPAIEEPECTLSLDGLKLKEGRLAVTIRGLPAGVWDSANEAQEQLIPCSWLSDPSSLSVFAEPSQLGEDVSFDGTSFSAKMEPPSGIDDGEVAKPIELGNEQVFTTDSGGFRSAILSPATDP